MTGTINANSTMACPRRRGRWIWRPKLFLEGPPASADWRHVDRVHGISRDFADIVETAVNSRCRTLQISFNQVRWRQSSVPSRPVNIGYEVRPLPRDRA